MYSIRSPGAALLRLGLLELIADGERLNRRMHNKAWIADNVGAIIGGRNLGNKYFSGPSETLFADLDVLTLGPVTREISRSFDRYWNSEWALPITAPEVASKETARATRRTLKSRRADQGIALRRIAEEEGPGQRLFATRRASSGRLRMRSSTHIEVRCQKSPEVESYVLTEVAEQCVRPGSPC